jgi:hypothetical protein
MWPLGGSVSGAAWPGGGAARAQAHQKPAPLLQAESCWKTPAAETQNAHLVGITAVCDMQVPHVPVNTWNSNPPDTHNLSSASVKGWKGWHQRPRLCAPCRDPVG